MKGMVCRFLLGFGVVFVVLLLAVAPICVFADVGEGEARLAVDVARGRVVVCYEAFVEAEGAGGNVSVLASVLGEAGGLLSGAEVALGRGDFDLAVNLSSDCTGRLEGFTGTAVALRDDAGRRRYVDFMVNVVGSLVGVVVVVVSGWVVWVLLKRKCVKVGGAV